MKTVLVLLLTKLETELILLLAKWETELILLLVKWSYGKNLPYKSSQHFCNCRVIDVCVR